MLTTEDNKQLEAFKRLLVKPKPKSRSKSSSSTKEVNTSRTRAREEKNSIPKNSSTSTPAQEKTSEAVEKDAYGFRAGSDISIALEELLKGGNTKHEVAKRVAERFKGQVTRGGKPKPVSTIMNQVERLMVKRGFRVQCGWILLPPEDGVIPPRPRGKRAAKAPESHPAVLVAIDPGTTNGVSIAREQKPAQRRPKPKPRIRRP